MSNSALDKILELLPELSEDDAFTLLYRIESQHGWVALAWSMGDVEVRDEDEDFGETDVPMTDAERNAVASTWEWRKGIADTASERVAESGFMPTVIRHRTDGKQTGFTVSAGFEEQRYTMDGTPVGG